MTVKQAGGSAGIVTTQYMMVAEPPNELALDCGERLGPITLAYETYGALNADKSNAILVTHAFSGDAHAAGFHEGDRKPGWWDDMIGPGRAFDTDKYFVISSNCIGGCKGSTGPSSINPKTGEPYGLEFPIVTVDDIVNAQALLLDKLGIERLLTVSGGSMGGMQALQWMKAYPRRVRSIIPIATTWRHTPQQIAFNEAGRQAVMADPNWNGGNYYSGAPPAKGLAVARMIGHITYMSDESMDRKFGRQRKNVPPGEKFKADFEVEGYLQNRGISFVDRFDANSYLYLTKALDLYDMADGGNLLDAMPRGWGGSVLVIAFKSDWLYPSYQSQQMVRACKQTGIDATYCEIFSTYGHDAFLVEVDEQTHLIKHFLRRVFEGE